MAHYNHELQPINFTYNTCYCLAYIFRSDPNRCWESRRDFQPAFNHHWLVVGVVKQYLHTYNESTNIHLSLYQHRVVAYATEHGHKPLMEQPCVLPKYDTAVWVFIVGTIGFLSRVSTLTRDIDIANMSVCPFVCLSVRNVPVSDENGFTYRHSFFTIR